MGRFFNWLGRLLADDTSTTEVPPPTGETRMAAMPARGPALHQARARASGLPELFPGVSVETNGTRWAELWFLGQQDTAPDPGIDWTRSTSLPAAIEETTGYAEVQVLGRLVDPREGTRSIFITHKGDGGQREGVLLLTQAKPAGVPRIWVGKHRALTFERRGATWVDEYFVAQMDKFNLPKTQTDEEAALLTQDPARSIAERLGLTEVRIVGRVQHPKTRIELVVIVHTKDGHDEPALVIPAASGTIAARKLLIDRPRVDRER